MWEGDAMDGGILNLSQTSEFLGISEKTLIKLLREEHIPARKIGREWRFSREALVRWLAAGDSTDYINRDERYMVSEDMPGPSSDLFDGIKSRLDFLRANGNRIQALLPEMDREIVLPREATLRVSYKQQREVEKLEFKIFWDLREECRRKARPGEKAAHISGQKGER
jgi:excisionase family DNA binding protein